MHARSNSFAQHNATNTEHTTDNTKPTTKQIDSERASVRGSRAEWIEKFLPRHFQCVYKTICDSVQSGCSHATYWLLAMRIGGLCGAQTLNAHKIRNRFFFCSLVPTKVFFYRFDFCTVSVSRFFFRHDHAVARMRGASKSDLIIIKV